MSDWKRLLVAKLDESILECPLLVYLGKSALATWWLIWARPAASYSLLYFTDVCHETVFGWGNISCGQHKATSCSKCPCSYSGDNKGQSWCSGDCQWDNYYWYCRNKGERSEGWERCRVGMTGEEAGFWWQVVKTIAYWKWQLNKMSVKQMVGWSLTIWT